MGGWTPSTSNQRGLALSSMSSLSILAPLTRSWLHGISTSHHPSAFLIFFFDSLAYAWDLALRQGLGKFHLFVRSDQVSI